MWSECSRRLYQLKRRLGGGILGGIPSFSAVRIPIITPLEKRLPEASKPAVYRADIKISGETPTFISVQDFDSRSLKGSFRSD
jgi:hypothetical protein